MNASRLLPFVAALLFVSSGLPVVRGNEVMRQVQEELRKRNLYFGDVNGLYSPQVAAALRRYQQRKGFEPTGEADNTTLHSLSLVTVAVVPTEPTSTPEMTPPTAVLAVTDVSVMPWPDLPVLRSDQGRENPEPPTDAGTVDLDPTPTPPLKPPPDAAFQRGPNEQALRSFVEDFLKRGESNAPDAQQDYFASRVDYFNEGKVDKSFIVRDTARYNKRWPSRHFELVGPIQWSGASDSPADKLVVNFHCRFDVRQSDHETKDPKQVKGEVENTYTLTHDGPDKLQIVSIKEQRVRKVKSVSGKD